MSKCIRFADRRTAALLAEHVDRPAKVRRILSRATAGPRWLPEPLEPRVLLSDSGELPREIAAPSYVPGQLLVKLREPRSSPRGGYGAMAAEANSAGPDGASLDDLLARYQVDAMVPVFPRAAAGPGLATMAEEEPEREDLRQWYSLTLPAETDVMEAAAAFQAMADVAVAEPNYEYDLADIIIPEPIEGIPDGFSDPGYKAQWHHAATKVEKSWVYLKQNGVYPGGKRDVVVAVIDSGVDGTHEDLVGNMWTNAAEVPGNNLDDDGNGFVDDIHGVTVVSDPRSHSGDSSDVAGHGTHVAGIIASQGFNGLGGVGVAFNVQIMSVRAAQYAGVLTTQDITEAILYAVDNGADVINMSFGGYGKSQLMLDALKVALNTTVLVAAAGNSSGPQMYPAAYSIVLGVAASTDEGKMAWFSNEGDIMAPGVGIYSTLPGGGYAAWSGTSMAAPVVSGVAALMRSYFWQRDIYSSRFIMGSILESGSVVDAYRALTEPPKPGVSVLETWLFDDKAISPRNDADGRIDSGETVHLAVELMNRSGQADEVLAVLEPIREGALWPDPNVTMNVSQISFGGIGPFNTSDNGFIRDEDGVITGVEQPFIFTVAADTPNDHIIPFRMTTYFRDGWDPAHPEYKRVSYFQYVVQRGKNVPKVIGAGQHVELTADDYWIVGGPVLIEAGASLTIREGTQVQWGAISSDPYNPGPQSGYIVVRGALEIEGTEQAPVNLFPSDLIGGQTVKIDVDGGTADMRYVTVTNPYFAAMRYIDHADFRWDAYTPAVTAAWISNSAFHHFPGDSLIASALGFDTVIFDASHVGPPANSRVFDSVLLPDWERGRAMGAAVPSFVTAPLTANAEPSAGGMFVNPRTYGDFTYVGLALNKVSLPLAEAMAQYFGGHVTSVRSQGEADTLHDYLAAFPGPPGATNGQQFIIGLTSIGHPGQYAWLDGSPLTFTDWAINEPIASFDPYQPIVALKHDFYWGGTYWGWRLFRGMWGPTYFVLRLPGEWTVPALKAAAESPAMLNFVVANYQGNLLHNAMLDRYWDPNVNTWSRYWTGGSAADYATLRDNFFATTSTTLFDHAVVDFYDNFTTPRLYYGTLPEHGFESTWPFVESVLVNGMRADVVPEVTSGPTTFTITFNRDMDTSIQPFVTFGPISPYTDFSAHPIGSNDIEFAANKAIFTVKLSQPADREVTVAYATEDGTAIAGVDYQPATGTVRFAPGQVQQFVHVYLLGNQVLEGNRTFSLKLSQPVVADIADGSAQGTLLDDDPVLSVNDVAIMEPAADSMNMQFLVSLSAAASRKVTVEYQTEDGTAKAGTDYTGVSGLLIFEPGETQTTVTVPVLSDTLAEGTEIFTLRLSHPTMVNLGDTVGEGFINETTTQLSVGDASIVESSGGSVTVTVPVTLSQEPGATVTVQYATLNGTAEAGADYETANGTLTFEPGGTLTQNVSLTVLGDVLDEVEEAFFLVLSDPVNAGLARRTGRVAISDDDDPLLSIGDAAITEGDSGTVMATFTVSLSAATSRWVSVRYATQDGTAGAASDYVPTSGVLTFEPGETEQTIFVPVLGELVEELDELFRVELSSPYNAQLGDATADGVIRDDDPKLSVDDVSVVEGDAGSVGLVFTVSLSADPIQPVTVDYATADGTALAGADYGAVNGTLTFLPGGPLTQTVIVPVSGDTEAETNETLRLNLSNASGAVISDAQGQGTIVGDDGLLLSIADAMIIEDHSGTRDAAFVVRISGDPGQRVTVRYTTQNGPALSGKDYHPVTAQLVFDPGQPLEQIVYVPVIGDTANESNETFTVKLYDATVAAIADDVGVGTIRDDDPLLSIDDTSLVEGHSGAKDVTVTIRISADPVVPVTVQYDTASGDALQGTDFLAAGGTVTFVPGGPLAQDITVRVLGDIDNEVHEAFVVDLSNATNAAISDGQGKVSILDDDGAKIVVSDASLAETDSGTVEAVFVVSLTESVAGPVTVDYATADGTARETSDYIATGGTLIFSPGGPLSQLVTVQVKGDLLDELNESFVLKLSNAVGVPILDGQGTATIEDNDQAMLSIDDLAVEEGYNGWVNKRQWQGVQWITPVTGEGYHQMRISGGVAASDKWLVSGYDVGRFRFEVRTMGVAAMTLQASGQEGSIKLTWQQNDYDLLAGYNVYRADTIDGTYTRINGTIIPVGQEYYVDSNVVPAVPKFYKFTVVLTDMTESAFSNIASAAALDTIPPVITHAPVVSAQPGRGLRITASVTDNIAVTAVDIYYRPMRSSEPYSRLPMVNVSGNDWSATIPGSAVQSPGVQYYLLASDGISEDWDGTPSVPHAVAVQATPTLASVSPNEGPASGGATVTLSGTLFQAGAQAYFGGVPASNIVVLSENQITLTAPPHFPAQVDVKVVNPDDTESTLLNGYRYIDTGIVLSLPRASGEFGAMVDVPLSLANITGLRAADITVTFDPAVLVARDARTGPLAFGWAISSNLSTPGTVRLSLASATAVSGSGALVYLQFEAIGRPPALTALTISSASLNDGAIAAELSHGEFAVAGMYDLSGRVSYFSGGAVPDAMLSLAGLGTYSAIAGEDGSFTFNDIPTGAYTLTSGKSDDVAEITAYDASLVLQAAAGLRGLSSNERLAADVNRNGNVSAMDASYILEHSVGLLSVPFPGAGRVWDFMPASRSYGLLNGDLTGQDFVGVLLGDVSGNWQAPSGAGLNLSGAASSAALRLGALEAAPGESVVMPLALEPNGESFYSADLTLAYDPARLLVESIDVGAAAEGTLYAINSTEPGLIRAGFAAAHPRSEGGVLMQVRFRVLDPLSEATSVLFQTARINETEVTADLTAGEVRPYPSVIVGGTGPDVIRLDADPAEPTRVRIFVNAVPGAPPDHSIPATAITSLSIDTSDGDDTLFISRALPWPISFNHGGGNDKLVIEEGELFFGVGSLVGTGELVLEVRNAAAASLGSAHLSGLLLSDAARMKVIGSGQTLQVDDLLITDAAVLDLAGNDLLIGTGSASAVETLVASGKLSTSVKTQYTGLTVAQNGAGVKVKYSYNGDANQDGVVNALDYFQIDSGFLAGATSYVGGDFNSDNTVNALDYFLIDSAFLGQSEPLSSTVATTDFSVGTLSQPAERTLFCRKRIHKPWKVRTSRRRKA